MWFRWRKGTDAQARIAAEGGIETRAQIIGAVDDSRAEDYLLVYAYTDA